MYGGGCAVVPNTTSRFSTSKYIRNHTTPKSRARVKLWSVQIQAKVDFVFNLLDYLLSAELTSVVVVLNCIVIYYTMHIGQLIAWCQCREQEPTGDTKHINCLFGYKVLFNTPLPTFSFVLTTPGRPACLVRYMRCLKFILLNNNIILN